MEFISKITEVIFEDGHVKEETYLSKSTVECRSGSALASENHYPQISNRVLRWYNTYTAPTLTIDFDTAYLPIA
jgi:hypothetical protein